MNLEELFSFNLCTRCTGRIFAGIGTGLTNKERGESLLFAYNALIGSMQEKTSCYICNGIFDQFDKYLKIVLDRLSGYEYNSFLVGSKFDPEILERENQIQEKFGKKGESIKKEFNREFGKYMENITGKTYSKDPDIIININTIYDYVEINVKSLYIYGVYTKMRRDLPQTRWIHGSGDSIESIIGEELKKITESENYYLHGSGREDVDVMMLGNGREFVIEASNPKKRSVNLEEFKFAVNSKNAGIKIDKLSFCDKKRVKEIKEAKHDKVYRAVIESDGIMDREKLIRACELLTGNKIEQQTPRRVLGNRSDIIRKKEIKYIKIEDIMDKTATIQICAEAGTYIKELVNGDCGRTNPSLTSLYGEKLRVKSLDVIYINRGD
ncbi:MULTISPECIES: tRNA pseudouridine(54/55) synthase Pus10 [Acidiplasma]|jgi:tRNA pseudouridine synthase 10|uniref:tRNA pseudouridine synthase Pus10 n=3 Tax=Acidiplasma TaxID=507753 RepID=A0A0Q0XM42_9ARCH|nr:MULTISPECIES: tRNA pseudouridine(54/55) synthase Pus10 [Acidiplasma]KJE48855.1 pseudouridine synthase [Acidiplasma sp. MBA-1]KPV44806.1 pseudouridine synthase [Acidiplasma aeolicum]KQB36579.1 pseudouridine synthase [Acidiplasma cupricumulans]WMT54254.1 MAG: tRNA pseudouridine(54/55) synthase Pus10 [Acidiplasma sp.]